MLEKQGGNEFGGGREIANGREGRVGISRRAITTLHEGQATRLTGRRNLLEEIRRCRGPGYIKIIPYMDIKKSKHFFVV